MYRALLGEQSYARDLYESVKRGDVADTSFGFNPTSEYSETAEESGQDWAIQRQKSTTNELILFTVRGMELHEVSPVSRGAYSDAYTGVRNIPQADDDLSAAIARYEEGLRQERRAFAETRQRDLQLRQMAARRNS